MLAIEDGGDAVMRASVWRCVVSMLVLCATIAMLMPASATARTKPDLVVRGVLAPGTVLRAGGTFHVTLIVANRGGRAAEPSSSEIVLSRDARRGPFDPVVGRTGYRVVYRARATSTRVAIRVPWATFSAAYRLLVCADASQRVAEANERNNCRATVRLLVAGLPAPFKGPTPVPPSPPTEEVLPPEEPVVPPTTEPAPEPTPEPQPSHVTIRECGTAALPLDGPAAGFTAMWNRSGSGWTGGDGEISVRLPDGRIAWVFADTFVGGVTAGHRDPDARLVSNTMVVQDGKCLETLVRGTAEEPLALVEPAPATTEGEGWYWPASARVEGSELLVLYYRMARTGPGQFDWRFAGTDEVAFSVPALEQVRVTPLVSGLDDIWGGAVVDGAAFTYVFGLQPQGQTSGLVVARTARGRLDDDPWAYWDGTGWVSDPEAARPVADDVTILSFLTDAAGWTMVTQKGFFSEEIVVRRAPVPQGPWDEGATIARAPAPAGGYTYGALLHPELGGDTTSMLLSYSVNGWAWADVLAQPDLYRPRFMRVDLTAVPGAGALSAP